MVSQEEPREMEHLEKLGVEKQSGEIVQALILQEEVGKRPVEGNY